MGVTGRSEAVMLRHADLHDGFEALLRANRALMLGLVWGALAACVVSSVIYDVGHWLHAW
jgi:hypothetical protein